MRDGERARFEECISIGIPERAAGFYSVKCRLRVILSGSQETALGVVFDKVRVFLPK